VKGLLFPFLPLAAEFAEALDESRLVSTALLAEYLAEVAQTRFGHRSAVLERDQVSGISRTKQKQNLHVNVLDGELAAAIHDVREWEAIGRVLLLLRW